MKNFIDMLPENKRNDERFMRMARMVEHAISRFIRDDGELIEVPMLCGVIIANVAMLSDNPLALIDAIHRLQREPFEGNPQPPPARDTGH
jgi:hypothetical protein